jgi:hypothetical protein
MPDTYFHNACCKSTLTAEHSDYQVSPRPEHAKVQRLSTGQGPWLPLASIPLGGTLWGPLGTLRMGNIESAIATPIMQLGKFESSELSLRDLNLGEHGCCRPPPAQHWTHQGSFYPLRKFLEITQSWSLNATISCGCLLIPID